MRESFSLQISFTNYRSKHVHRNIQNWSSFLFQVNTECIHKERQLSKSYSKIWANRLCTVFWVCWRFILTRHRCKTKPSAHNLLTRNCHRDTLGRKRVWRQSLADCFLPMSTLPLEYGTCISLGKQCLFQKTVKALRIKMLGCDSIYFLCKIKTCNANLIRKQDLTEYTRN